jgi:hypothetical protein
LLRETLGKLPKHCGCDSSEPTAGALSAAVRLREGYDRALSTIPKPAQRRSDPALRRGWRDLGYAVGALASGVITDVFGFVPAILAIAALTLVSGGITASMMRDTAR